MLRDDDNQKLIREDADRVPEVDSRLLDLLDAAERPSMPSQDAWDSVWERIESAAPAQVGSARRRGYLRLWQPVVALAACWLLVVLWRGDYRATRVEAWPTRLATDVVINSLEVGENSVPLVVSSGADGFKMVWVLDESDSG